MRRPEVVQFACEIPVALHRRAKIVSRRARLSISHLVRVGLEHQLDAIESKEREEEQRREEARRRRKTSVLSGLTPLEERAAVEVPLPEVHDRMTAVFQRHAERIFQVATDPGQVTLRQKEAFDEIRRLAPLTYADTHKITARLEAIIATRQQLDASAPADDRDEYAPAMRRPPSLRPLDGDAPATAGGGSQVTEGVLIALRQMFGKGVGLAAPAPEADELTGKSITSTRTRGVLDPNDDEETSS